STRRRRSGRSPCSCWCRRAELLRSLPAFDAAGDDGEQRMRVRRLDNGERLETVGAPQLKLAQKKPPLVVELPAGHRNRRNVTAAEDLRLRETVAPGIRLGCDAAQVRTDRGQRVIRRAESLQLWVVAIAAAHALDHRL